MFQRRKPRSWSEKARESLWPSMGWKRTARYGLLRIIRLKATTKSLAIGFAYGASISFTPLPGAHIISATTLTYLSRGNILSCLGGTLIGNPWTFPFMWLGAYHIGNTAFRLLGKQVETMPDHLSWAYFMDEITHHPMDIIVPWVTGGVILMALSWPVFYIGSYYMFKNMREKYQRATHK